MEQKKDLYKAQKKYLSENFVKLGINVRPETRDNFRKACEKNGTLPGTVLRKFIEDYIQNAKRD